MKKDISCRITRTLLMYVRETHHGSLDGLLDGLPLDETFLSDVNNWVSHEFLQLLYERMITLLGDPEAVYKMTLASERFQSLGFLHRLAILVGSPRLIYAQAPKYNRLLKLNGDVFIHEVGPSWLIVEDRYHNAAQKTRHDCDYTRGVFAGIPTLFGLPIAEIEELECQVAADKYGRRTWPDHPVQGARGCLYRVNYGKAKKAPLWHRLFRRPGIYRKAIEDLLDANRTIQEKYNQVVQLAADLDAANKKLQESKRQLETSKAELEVSEKKYRILAENASDIIWTLDLKEMRFTYVSPSIRKVRGFAPHEPVVGGLRETVSPQNLRKLLAILDEELRRDQQPEVDPKRYRTVEIELRHRDGSYFWTEGSMTFMRDPDGKPTGVLGVTRDIRERKIAQAALNAEKERLAVTLRSIAEGVITTDRDGAIVLINPVAEKLTGWTEAQALGQPLQTVFRVREPQPPPLSLEAETLRIERGAGQTLASDTLLIAKDGEETAIAQSIAPILDSEQRTIGTVVVFRNISEQRKLEKELQKIEKLESLGMLAGGIAHDFNNFLSGILGNISLARLELQPSDCVQTRLEEMEKAALRARNLTLQLLTFSKGGDPVKKPTALADLIVEAALFASRGSRVKCEFEIAPDLAFANVDEGQIAQVIHNLILNAEQAMPEGGTIHVSGENTNLPGNNGLSLAAGPYAKITIHDQGSGIKPQDLKKIFDPYFTTKQKGSGLGLAVVYSVIDKHGGRINVASQVGSGTTFSIYLPAVPGLAKAPTLPEALPASGKGRILVMDDEPFIRELAEEMLSLLGYEVTSVKNGQEALQVYQAARVSQKPFDAVVLDLTVPGAMGGKEALEHFLEIDPQVKAIVSSGYSNDPVMSNYSAFGFRKAIQKPYRIQEISEALKTVIHSTPAQRN